MAYTSLSESIAQFINAGVSYQRAWKEFCGATRATSSSRQWRPSAVEVPAIIFTEDTDLSAQPASLLTRPLASKSADRVAKRKRKQSRQSKDQARPPTKRSQIQKRNQFVEGSENKLYTKRRRIQHSDQSRTIQRITSEDESSEDELPTKRCRIRHSNQSRRLQRIVSEDESEGEDEDVTLWG